MADFINTIDALGDDVVMDSLIDRTITEFKDNKLTTIGLSAFSGCTALTEVDLPNVTAIGKETFKSCSALEKVNLPSLISLENSVETGAFSGCNSLREIVLTNAQFIGSAVGNNWSGFFSGSALEKLILPNATHVGRQDFGNCKELTYVDLWKIRYIWGEAFGGCSSLTAFIMRPEEKCGIFHSNILNGTPIAAGAGYIYVPSALVDSYKAATNWSTYAAQFRALEDYTVDGTTTGELDESKI